MITITKASLQLLTVVPLPYHYHYYEYLAPKLNITTTIRTEHVVGVLVDVLHHLVLRGWLGVALRVRARVDQPIHI